MIIDSFIFFNELNILEGRLEYLYDHVDYFVLVETDITFSGNAKPFVFRENMQRYHRYLDKIIYSPFRFKNKNSLDFSYRPKATDYSAPQWQVEYAQRNHLVTAAEIFDSGDLLMISDVDEIPSRAVIEMAKTIVGTQVDSAVLEQDLYYYNFLKKQRHPWLGTVIATNAFAQKNSAQWLRGTAPYMPRFHHAGWHLSYWTDLAGIQYKIQSFSHQELNTHQHNNPQNILTSVANNQDLFNKQLDIVDADPASIDQDFRSVFEKYATTIGA